MDTACNWLAYLTATVSHCTFVQVKSEIRCGGVLDSHSKQPAVFRRSIRHPNLTHGEGGHTTLCAIVETVLLEISIIPSS